MAAAMASVSDRLGMAEVGAALENATTGQLSFDLCGDVLMWCMRLGLGRVEAAARVLALDGRVHADGRGGGGESPGRRLAESEQGGGGARGNGGMDEGGRRGAARAGAAEHDPVLCFTS
jgi:hypothetical protein